MDPRLTPANQNVACSSLRGQIEHTNFVEGQNYQVSVPFVDLLGAPGGKRNRQLVYGSKVKYFSETDGWAFIQNAYDNYVGYVPGETINLDTNKTHIVSVPLSHIFSEPNIKAKNIATLPLTAKVSGKKVENGFLETELGWIPVRHLQLKTKFATNPVEVAKLFLNSPYLWGGNTSLGIDCSGLIQVSMSLCGLRCPGDSDQQLAKLGENIEIDTTQEKGDIIFWKGHVALALNARQVLHANAYHMSTVIEELSEAVLRIKNQEGNDIIARKRLIGELYE